MLGKPSAKYAFLLFVAVLWLLPIEAPLFDWDEINFATCAREMLLRGNYTRVTVNFLPFYEKPPLFFWLQSLSMQLLGQNAYAARLPNALCGLLTLWLLSRWTTDRQRGQYWLLFYACSWLPHLYFQSGIIDPIFNLLIVAGMMSFVRARHLLYPALLLGAAVLTKGFVAGLIFGLVGVIVSRRRQHLIRVAGVIGGSTLVAGLWFGLDFWYDGGTFTQAFIRYQWALLTKAGAGHEGFPGYHVVVLLLGVFPASVWALPQLFRRAENEQERWLQALFWVVLLLFSLVQTKIMHYSSLCYFPLTYWAAKTWQSTPRSVPLRRLTLALGVLFALVVGLVPVAGLHLETVLDELAVTGGFVRELTGVEVAWSYAEGGLLALSGGGLAYAIFRYRSLWLMSVGYVLWLNIALWNYLPRIAEYTQGAGVDFYRTHQDGEAYFLPVGFKTYAHLFYGKVKPEDRPLYADKARWENHLLSGKSRRPVYFIVRADRLRRWEKRPKSEQIRLLYAKNGYVFFMLD